MAGERSYAVEQVAAPESIDSLHDLLARVARENPEVPRDDLSMMETAVIEIAGNLVEHGRPPGEVTYRFDLTLHADRLEGVMADSGEELPGGLTDLVEVDVMSESGRGLFLADAVLDTLVYRRTDAANIWSMTRRYR